MSNALTRFEELSISKPAFKTIGKVIGTVSTTVDVTGLKAPIGARCEIITSEESIYADVIGFAKGVTKLQPLEKPQGLTPNAKVRLISNQSSILISDNLIGKVINPLGKVIIGNNNLSDEHSSYFRKINCPPVELSNRSRIDKVFDTGVRAINSMLTLGVGQRVGLFAGTGVGKSVLLSMITKNSQADIVVIGLVGERGREVYEFFNDTLDEAGRQKSIIVAAPADASPIMRLQCPEVATTIAEHYRDQGKNVLLLIDSVTRYAQAQREVALSSGETPATKGYPPSVFSKLPTLIERAGKTKTGAITAIYTVLTEGDDLNDPIADSARGVLDGHIVLSRELASRGIYPAIDIPNSISRLSQVLVSPSYLNALNEIKSYYYTLNENIDLIDMGLVEKGKNKKLDSAIKNEKFLLSLIKQTTEQKFTLRESQDFLVDMSLKMRDL